ncbi:MAG: ATP-binding protein [Planctomycetota bacterium]|nr:ATP-binding protein [Planctomycetota bacterium]
MTVGDRERSAAFDAPRLLDLLEHLALASDCNASFDLLCEWVVGTGHFSRAYYAGVLPAYGLAFGAAGLDCEERERLAERERRWEPRERTRNRERVLAMYRVADALDVVFVPEGMREGLPNIVLGGPPGEGAPGERWEAGDDLVLLPHSADGTSLGMLALAAPASGRRPTDDDLELLTQLLAVVRAGAQVVFARDAGLSVGKNQSRRILEYVETLTGAAERQELADRIAEQCARIAGYQTSVLTVHMDDGPLIGAWNVTADQRERLRAAAESTSLERSAARRRAVREFAFPGTGICYVPHDADLQRSSGYGRTSETMVGSWHPDDRLFLMVSARRGTDFGVLSLDMPDDGSMPTEDQLGPLRVAESFLQLGATLLQARMMDAHLVRSNRLEALGTLAAGVAHDFNNIIGVMLGYASLLRMKAAGNEDLVRMTSAIEESATRAAALTARLRGLTRGGTGEPRPVDLGGLVEDCVRVARETFDRRIEISADVMDDLPPVVGDVAALYRCLMNVCVNARDALPDGGAIRIAARAERSPGFLGGDASRTWIHVLVDDSGPGIDEELQDRIFEPFFTTKARSDNRGLGLFMSYNVVRAHNGTIQVARSPLGGTRVRVMLPASDALPDDEVPTGPEGFPLDYDVRVKPAHVLVVEDEEMLQDLIVTGLELLGHSADVVGDGALAIERLSRSASAYDLVVLDLVLPKRSGLDVFRHLQGLDPTLPVIVSSGNVEEGLQDPALSAKVAGILEKPWRLEEFQDAVQRVLLQQGEAAANGDPAD